MSTIWNPPDWHQRQAAREEAKLKIKEYAAALASNPYVTQYKEPTTHEDWTYEWSEVSRDKVITLLRSGVVVKAVATDEEPALTSEMLTVNGPRGCSLDGLSDFTVGVILDTRWKNCRFVVRTE